MIDINDYFTDEGGLACEFGANLPVCPIEDAKRIAVDYANQSKWIRVNDALPKKGQIILIHGLGGRQLTSIYWPFDNEDFYCYNMWSEELEPIEEVTHWQELPSAPL